jgi:hypothetical protein
MRSNTYADFILVSLCLNCDTHTHATVSKAGTKIRTEIPRFISDVWQLEKGDKLYWQWDDKEDKVILTKD